MYSMLYNMYKFNNIIKINIYFYVSKLQTLYFKEIYINFY